MASGDKSKGVLMVCLGNICRSPIAEAVLQDVLGKRGMSHIWFVDSAATCDYHTGKNPDRRAQEVMQSHGIKMAHKARTLTREDFSKFDYIFGMDHQNVRDIQSEAPAGSKAVVEMFGLYDPQDPVPIRDPYYDRGSDGFEVAYERCLRCANRFLDKHAS